MLECAGNGGAGSRVLTYDFDGIETQQDNNMLQRGGRCAYARCLIMAYCAVMHVHKKLVRAFCQGQAADESSLAKLALSWIGDLQLDWLRNYDVAANLEVRLMSLDLQGNMATSQADSRHVKYLKVALRHICSLDQTPLDLGSVVFGETFLVAPGPGQEAVVVTEQIEAHCAWTVDAQEQDTECMTSLLNRLSFSSKNRHYSMGALVREDAIEGVRMLTGIPEMPVVPGQLWIFQRGLIFSSARLGSIALDFAKHLGSFGYFNTDNQARDDDKTAVLSFGLKSKLDRYGILEASLSIPPSSIVFSTGHADRRVLVRDVLPDWLKWFKSEEVDISPLDGIPAGFSDAEPLSEIEWGSEPLSVDIVSQPKIQSYLNTLQALDARLHSKALKTDSNDAAQRPDRTQACRLIVVLGEPGCDKHKLVQGAMELAGLATRWKLVSYKNPRSPFDLSDADLAATILQALPDVSAGAYSHSYSTPALDVFVSRRCVISSAQQQVSCQESLPSWLEGGD